MIFEAPRGEEEKSGEGGGGVGRTKHVARRREAYIKVSNKGETEKGQISCNAMAMGWAEKIGV